MLVKIQECVLVLQVNLMESENLVWNMISPENKFPFHAVSNPSEAPTEGRKLNLLIL